MTLLILTVKHLIFIIISSKFCAVFSLEPLVQDPRKEIMNLRHVKQFTPLPLPCSALPGA